MRKEDIIREELSKYCENYINRFYIARNDYEFEFVELNSKDFLDFKMFMISYQSYTKNISSNTIFLRVENVVFLVYNNYRNCIFNDFISFCIKNTKCDKISLSSIIFECSKMINGFLDVYSKIKKEFPKSYINKNGNIVVKYDIIPEFVIYDKDSIKIEHINENSIVIENIEITVGKENEILSIRLSNNYHPNCDEYGYYCVGGFKYNKLTLEIIYDIINNIKLFNLLDCYKIPESILKLLGDKI